LNPGTSQYEDRRASDVTTAVCVRITLVAKKFLLPGKIKGDLRKLDVAESKCGHQNAASPATFKGEEFKDKNYVFNKKD
jgi:hypothetical protein